MAKASFQVGTFLPSLIRSGDRAVLPHVASFHITSHCLMTIFSTKHLVPDCHLDGAVYSGNFSTLGDGIYHGQLVTDQFCDLILDRIKQHEKPHTKDLYKQANSMHQEAILVDQLGLGPLIEAFSNFFLKDIASELLPDVYLPPLDGIHSYIVRYSKSLDHDLGFHVDDSFLTINLCLNDSFKGSELVFEGARCPRHIETPATDSERTCVDHKKGYIVFHHGKNRHYVKGIEDGERYNLIIWCQNSAEYSRWFDASRTRACLDFCNYSP